MNTMMGTIYIRDNELCKHKNVYKLGIASFGKNRDDSYVTYEHKRGEMVRVFTIPLLKMKIIDNCMKHYFQEFRNYQGGGTEYYDRCIIDMIEPYLQKLNIEYKVLTKKEINTMERCNRLNNLPNIHNLKNTFNNLNVQNIIQKYKNKNKKINVGSNISPNAQQLYVLNIIEDFYKSNDIGKIIWACGLGKALLSIMISKKLNYKSILLGVPSKYLQKQLAVEILKIFPENNIILVGGDEITKTTEQVKLFLNSENNEPRFVISTYHSCHLLVDIKFDFKIGDEAHHLVGVENEKIKGFRLFHKIISKKTLFMTATEKILETTLNKKQYSMDDVSVFGNYIDVKTVRWAIENKKITDYSVLILKNTEDEVDEIISNLKVNVQNKELFMSCLMCLKSFEKYKKLTHLLLYTNTTKDAECAKKYINDILSLDILSIAKEDVYNNALHSKSNVTLKGEINKFKKSLFGIIPCVYIFGEGFDLPKLNAVCIAGNMKSEIRIVQYLLRSNRLEFENPEKISHIIIPYIDTDDWKIESESYNKVRTIVSQMRNVDETIEQKIVVSSIYQKKKIDNRKNPVYRGNCDLEENGNELNKIKLRLRNSKTLNSKFTQEQNEYNYIKCINTCLNIQSKKEYVDKKHLHENFINSPEEYFKAKGVWKDWYDFIGIDTSKFIQTKHDWIRFCKQKNVISINDYGKKCEIYDNLPKDPVYFYKNFSNIPNELSFNKGRR